jgi:hypothetical protein
MTVKRTFVWLTLLLLTAVPTSVALAASLVPPPKPAPPRAEYEIEYRILEGRDWKTDFPNLGDRFDVLAPSTGRPGKKGAYNCIAHTMRIYDRWVWPGERVADFDQLYGKEGYRRGNRLDYSFDPRIDKIVLYAKRVNDKIVCTHGCRQLADGTWTSKLGGGPLIRHLRPESVGGPAYGAPLAVYTRARRTGPGPREAVAPGLDTHVKPLVRR